MCIVKKKSCVFFNQKHYCLLFLTTASLLWWLAPTRRQANNPATCHSHEIAAISKRLRSNQSRRTKSSPPNIFSCSKSCFTQLYQSTEHKTMAISVSCFWKQLIIQCTNLAEQIFWVDLILDSQVFDSIQKPF